MFMTKEAGENYILRSFINCTSHQILIRLKREEEVRMGDRRIFFGNLKGEDLLEDNIKMDLKEMGWKDVDWSHLIQD